MHGGSFGVVISQSAVGLDLDVYIAVLEEIREDVRGNFRRLPVARTDIDPDFRYPKAR